MNGIEQIRESREHGYVGLPQDNYECLQAERHVDYLLSEVDRLHTKAKAGEALWAAVALLIPPDHALYKHRLEYEDALRKAGKNDG